MSECTTFHDDRLDFVFDNLNLRFESIDSLIDILVRFLEVCEEMKLHLFWSSCIVVISLNELYLGQEGCVLLLHSTVPVILHLLGLLQLCAILFQLVDVRLLCLNQLLQLG